MKVANDGVKFGKAEREFGGAKGGEEKLVIG